MSTSNDKIVELLHLAGETHHLVYRKEEGNDPDWATWYSDWLVNHTDLPGLLGKEVVRSKLTKLLVELDVEYTASGSDMRWPEWYTEELIKRADTLAK